MPLSRDPLRFLLELHNDGPVSFMRLGPYPVYTLNDPALIEEVLVGKHRSCIKDKSTRDVSPLTGQGLLTSEGELWRQQRKIAAPPLQPKRIAGYAAAIDTRAEAERVARVLDVFMLYFERQVYSVEGLLPLGVPTRRRLQMRRAVHELDAVVYPIIERCRASGSTDDHLLARLVRTRGEGGEPLSDLQLRDEAVTMLLAGHETTVTRETLARFGGARARRASRSSPSVAARASASATTSR